jgi:magnesium-transporting ATPase (P-type)
VEEGTIDEILLSIAHVCKKAAKQRSCQLMLPGKAIDAIKKTKYKKELINLFKRCSGVILFRASPDQKANLIDLMKSYDSGRKTLAIGDGANDVAMIRKAHVGVGIMGKEGNHASAYADYAIPGFKDLRRLLFVHGSNFAIKLENAVLWCMFKTTIYGVAVWFFNHKNGFSGYNPIENLLWSLYGICMTTFSLVFYILYEQNIDLRKYGKGSGSLKQLPFKMSAFYDIGRAD